VSNQVLVSVRSLTL